MKYIFYLFWMVIVITGITFSGLNATSIAINYYFDTSTLPLPILLLITLAIGVLLGLILVLPALLKNKNANRQLKHHVKRLEQEVNNLRAIPIKEAH